MKKYFYNSHGLFSIKFSFVSSKYISSLSWQQLDVSEECMVFANDDANVNYRTKEKERMIKKTGINSKLICIIKTGQMRFLRQRAKVSHENLTNIFYSYI